MSAANLTPPRLLDEVVASQLPLSSGTMRELLVAELERRTRAEAALEVVRERGVELLYAVNCHQLLLTHVPGCTACARSTVGCATYRELERDIKAHLERAAALAK